MVYIKFGIVFELFVYKIHGDSDRAFLCGTEILNSRLNEMDFRRASKIEQQFKTQSIPHLCLSNISTRLHYLMYSC